MVPVEGVGEVRIPLTWLNAEMMLFDCADQEDFLWLRDIGVKTINRGKDGSDRAVLYGRLPVHGPYLDSLDKGHTFHITWRECGPPDDYRDQDVVIVLSDCKVLRRWVDNPVIISPNDLSAVYMHVLLLCKVEMRYEGGA